MTGETGETEETETLETRDAGERGAVESGERIRRVARGRAAIEVGPFSFGRFELPRPRALRALHHREFRLVWSTFLVGQLGFWISFVSLQALMARLTASDGSWLGVLFFVNFIPMLLFTPLAGVVADRVERRRVLVVTFSCMGSVMVVLATLVLSEQITPVGMLPFAFAVGTVFAFNAPASQSVVANAVPGPDLPSAISLQSVGGNLSRVVGPTLAAPVLALWNEGAAFAIYAAASGVVVLMLRRLELSPHVPEADDGLFWARLRRGLDHARERPPALAALSLLGMSSLFAGAYLALLPVVADEVFERGAPGFATLAAVTGLGSLLGALTTGVRESVPTLRSVALLVGAFGASLALFAVTPSWGAALVAVAVVGGFYFAAMTTLNTLLQYLTDEDKRGRMMSLFLVGWAGLIPIGGLWQGILASAHGVEVALALAGVVTALYGLVAGAMPSSGKDPVTPGRARVL